jgi:hypothetical protein
MLLDFVTELSEEDALQQGAGHGGYRTGAGRKPKYGGKTVIMRVSAERVEDIERFLADGDGKLSAVVEVLKRWREKET